MITTARSGDPKLDQWFTPFWAAEELIYDAIGDLGEVSVCEPSCGNGSFLCAIPPEYAAFGVEIDPIVAEAARENSGREVLVGDFRSIDLENRPVQVILGNPPFKTSTIAGFLDRAHQLLPEGGLLAFILPGYSFQTPSRVMGWMDRFQIDVNLIPRTLFPGISKDLVWAKFRKGGPKLYRGLMLFAEQRDVEMMRRSIRHALERPGTWREAVRVALESLGGEASLPAIYDMIAPERRAGRAHWQPKVRQILQLHFHSRGAGRWSLAA